MRFGRKPELTPERVEDIRGLRQAGTTLPEIMHFTARAIGCSANEALAVLSVAMGQRITASKVATKALQRPSWAVLDDVAECGPSSRCTTALASSCRNGVLDKIGSATAVRGGARPSNLSRRLVGRYLALLAPELAPNGTGQCETARYHPVALR